MNTVPPSPHPDVVNVPIERDGVSYYVPISKGLLVEFAKTDKRFQAILDHLIDRGLDHGRKASS